MVSVSRTGLLLLVFCSVSFLCARQDACALDKRLSFSLSHFIMGGYFERRGESDASIREYKKALRFDYKNPVIHLNLGLDYLKKNDFPNAINELSLAVKFNPEAVEPHAILALLYFSQDKNELATQEYEIALKNASKLEPKNVDILKSLGAVYLRQKKLKEAESTFTMILGLSPDDSESHFYLANIYDEQKDRPRAIGELKKALEIKYDYPEALNYLGYIYVESNQRLDEAGKMIRRAVEMDPENGAYVDSLGWLYFKQGEPEEALKVLKKASTLLEDPVILDHLGDAYFALKDLENAKKNWQASWKLDPSQSKVREKLDRLDTKEQ